MPTVPARPRWLTGPCVWLCALLGALPLQGQAVAGQTFGHALPVPSVEAVRRVGPIKLDGRLDDEAWKAATPITRFTQFDPDWGKPASERTEVSFLYDDEALYVGARMYDSAGARGVTTRLVRRDTDFDSDYLQIVIDGYHDHLSRAFFNVNPSGSKNDDIGIGNSCCDASWDPVWEAVTRIDSAGWTAEIRIPFSQLRFSRDSVQTWGLEVRRFIKRRNEQDDWATWPKTDAGGPSRFGHLTGLRIPASTSHLELLPYVVVKSASLASQVGSPFDTHARPTTRVGLDLKDRLTSNLTLDATINPDFGQVEVDPAVLNLSALETFFPEKRPFFIEGAQVFDFGSQSCNFCSYGEGMTGFYSRRVGRAPTGADLALSNFPSADVPDATTILGAGKITGRTQSGYTVGLLNAVTGRETARVQDLAGQRGSQEVEPLADYLAGRVKRDFLDGNLVVGGMVSGVARNIDSTFAPRLARHAEMIGNDVVYAWDNKTYDVTADWVLTNVSGDRREIALRERSSARYFQRPDRGSASSGLFTNSYDTTVTALRGGGVYTRLAKETGNWFGELQLNTRTPGFESNDYSFQQHADYALATANLGRLWSNPTSWYHQIIAIAGTQGQRNFEGNWTGAQFHAFGSVTTPQFWNVTGVMIHRPVVLDDQALRGGPLVQQPSSDFGSVGFSTDSRHALVAGANVGDFVDSRGTVNPNVALSVAYRPAPNVSLSIGPSWNALRTYAQYVDAVTDPTAALFYGTRYVVSGFRQRTLGLDTRASLTFSPTMTLELYVQPFFASARYYDFGEFAAPRTNDVVLFGRGRGTIAAVTGAGGIVTQYTIDPDGAGPAQPFTIANPNVSEQSLRGNAVFRWEYRPGSVLYVAWTQSRLGDSAFGDLEFPRDRIALLAARPDNIFLVKISWWLPR